MLPDSTQQERDAFPPEKTACGPSFATCRRVHERLNTRTFGGACWKEENKSKALNLRGS
ncbi:hypothetical protein PISMIDRAFT_680410, partial [Pisolithus microcarpus 441]